MTDMTIDAAVGDADLRVLVMCLFQITGDRKWLAEPYLPRRDVRLIAPEDAGFPEPIADEIRAATIDAFGDEPAIADPGDELMSEMMSACLGEPVGDEYAPMMREEMGFVSRDVPWPEGARATQHPRRRRRCERHHHGRPSRPDGTRLRHRRTRIKPSAGSGATIAIRAPESTHRTTPTRSRSLARTVGRGSSRRRPTSRPTSSQTADECDVTRHIEFDTSLHRRVLGRRCPRVGRRAADARPAPKRAATRC